MKKLIIAEKPSLAMNIVKALNVREKHDGYFENDSYVVSFAYGHLFQLKNVSDYTGEKTTWESMPLPFIPEKFSFKLKEEPGVKKQFEILKKLIERVDISEIVHCGDADREGQVIIDLIILASRTGKAVKRLWLPEQTEETIRSEIRNMKNNEEYKNYYNEGIARTYLDWLMGINITVYVSVKAGSKFNSGRVLIPIVKFIYDRDMAIKNFIPEKYYILESNTNNIKLSIKEPRYSIKELPEALKESEILNKKKAIVNEIEKKEIKKTPPKLFSLSKLQSKLSKDYKMTFDKSLKIIQELYEKGYLTYPRTNTQYLAEAEKEKVRKIIETLNDSELEFKDTKRIFDDTKIESHSAIIITSKLPGELSEEENKVYMTVKNRFISNFLKEDTIINQTVMKITVGSQNFDFKGESIKSEGFLKYEKQELTNSLPDLQKGEEFEVHFKPEEKVTTAPVKITEETLSNFLENPFRKEIKEAQENENEEYKNMFEGVEIGTQATRTGIIENAIKIGYISRNKGAFSIEDKGIKFIETLNLLEIDLYKEKTVEFSKSLKQIFSGKKSVEVILKEAEQELKNIINKDVKVEKYTQEKEVIGKCPKCGAKIYESNKSFYCEKYKEGCKTTLWKESKYFDQVLKITKEKAKKLIKGDKVKFKLKGKNNEYEAYFTLKMKGDYINLEKGEFVSKKKSK